LDAINLTKSMASENREFADLSTSPYASHPSTIAAQRAYSRSAAAFPFGALTLVARNRIPFARQSVAACSGGCPFDLHTLAAFRMLTIHALIQRNEINANALNDDPAHF
jgi:hypothetical protein